MVEHAAISAAQPNSSLKTPSMASLSFEERNNVCAQPTVCSGLVARQKAEVKANFRSRNRESDSGALGNLPSRIPSSTRGHASGPNRRPAALRHSASLTAPLRGLGSSPKKFENRGKERRANFFRAPPRKHSLALGSRARSLGFA
jgi:hypothetical protein